MDVISIPASKRIAAVRSQWERLAGEEITIKVCSGALYAFGSELATLRLYRKFARHNPNLMTQDYSQNLQQWFFRQEFA